MRTRVERLLRDRGEPRRRRVQERDRIAELPQLAAPDHLVGQRLGQARGIGRERARDHLAQRLLAKTRGGGVHRRQTILERRVVAHHPELRVHDLRPEIAFAHVAVDAHARPDRQRLLLVGIEREEPQHQARARIAVRTVLEQAYELPPRPVLDIDVDDGALGLQRLADLHPGERHEPRVVLVAQRQVQHEVFLARDAEARELVGERDGVRPRFLRGRIPGLARH